MLYARPILNMVITEPILVRKTTIAIKCYISTTITKTNGLIALIINYLVD